MSPPKQGTFKKNAHINYFLRCLRALPSSAEGHDSNRITIAYFCLSGLDLLGALDEKTTAEQREGWADWIWGLQAPDGGFRGSTFMTTDNPETSPGHLPSTYTALLCLAILRSPLDRLNIPNLKTFVKSCQASDGSFSPVPPSPGTHAESSFQNDLRMIYVACVICDIIKDFPFDIEATRNFIARCRTWEGGYASRPGVIEAQGGTTYCATASLHMLSSIFSSSTPHPESSETVGWLVHRQIGGFQGRPGKFEDVCYSFWCGAALSIMNKSNIIDRPSDKSFLLSAQSPMGGFGKEPEDYPDPFHSYLALAALSLSESSGTKGKEDSKGNRDDVSSDVVRESVVERGAGAALEVAPDLGLKKLDAVWNVSSEVGEWLRTEIVRVRRSK